MADEMVLDVVVQRDGISGIEELPEESVHLILSDIPYGIGADEWDVLHRNTNSAYLGSSPAQERAGAIFKRRGKPLNGWSQSDRKIPQQYQEWCARFSSAWLRALKPGGSAMVFAGRRLSHRCVVAFEDAGFTYKDTLAWLRPSAPFRAQRLSTVFAKRGDKESSDAWEGWRVGNLSPRFEPILWFVKPYTIGETIADNVLEHGVGGFNLSGFERYVSGGKNVVEAGFDPGESGKHLAQKPTRLMEALIVLTTKRGQVVVDPFCGSGSTLVAAKSTGRRFIGYDSDEDAVRVAEDRLAFGTFEGIWDVSD